MKKIMTITDLSNPIESKIQLCEKTQEAWKISHEAALKVFKFEDLLGNVVECYDDLQRFEEFVAKQVGEDGNRYDPILDERLVSMERRLHNLAEVINSERLPDIESQVSEIDNIAEFRTRLNAMREDAAYGYRKAACEKNDALIDDIFESLNIKRAS